MGLPVKRILLLWPKLQSWIIIEVHARWPKKAGADLGGGEFRGLQPPPHMVRVTV